MTVYRFIAAEKANYPILLMCKLLEVARSGFYAWQRSGPSYRTQTDSPLCRKIAEIYKDSGESYGAPRVHAELARQGIKVGRKRVERLMVSLGIQGISRRRKRRQTTVRVDGVKPATDLVDRNFNPDRPNLVWTADITEIETEEGKLYLAETLDCYSRAVVGWAMRDNIEAQIVVDALEMAVQRRRPDDGVIHHSDHGSQYTSLLFSRRLEEAGIAQSMGSKGDCFDNAVCESFHATLKTELLYRQKWATRQEARTAIFKWIEGWYNPRRLHSTLGYLSPLEYEQINYKQEEQQVSYC